MAEYSAIEWTDATWNPVTGCSAVSSGCDHCYARRITERFGGRGAFDTVRLHPERLDKPLRWRKPRRVFVNSMSDLFHDDVATEFIAHVFAVMALSSRHAYQVLTKRHGRMRTVLSSEDFREAVAEHATDIIGHMPPHLGAWRLDLGGQRLAGDSGLGGDWTATPTPHGNLWSPPWPLPNVWLGVSAETQKWANIRIPALLDTPATVRFVSAEPLLGPINLYRWLDDPPGLDWVIAGGESGPHARPIRPEWVRSLRDQCTTAGAPFFFKQWGGRTPKAGGRTLDGRTWMQIPRSSREVTDAG